MKPAAVTVFARRHLPRRTGGQLCAHHTGEPARRISACRRECAARAVQPAARAPARRRHGAPAPRGRAVYTPAERDCGRVRSRPPCGRRPPVEVGIWRVAISRWTDGRRFLWTRNIKKTRASIKSLTTGSDCRGCNLMMPLFSIKVPVSSWTTGSNCRSWWLMIPLSPIIYTQTMEISIYIIYMLSVCNISPGFMQCISVTAGCAKVNCKTPAPRQIPPCQSFARA